MDIQIPWLDSRAAHHTLTLGLNSFPSLYQIGMFMPNYTTSAANCFDSFCLQTIGACNDDVHDVPKPKNTHTHKTKEPTTIEHAHPQKRPQNVCVVLFNSQPRQTKRFATLLMEENVHHLIGSSSHYLRDLYIPGGVGFLPSTVLPPPKKNKLKMILGKLL